MEARTSTHQLQEYIREEGEGLEDSHAVLGHHRQDGGLASEPCMSGLYNKSTSEEDQKNSNLLDCKKKYQYIRYAAIYLREKGSFNISCPVGPRLCF